MCDCNVDSAGTWHGNITTCDNEKMCDCNDNSAGKWHENSTTCDTWSQNYAYGEAAYGTNDQMSNYGMDD